MLYLGRFQPYYQTLDWAGKACAPAYLASSSVTKKKSFITLTTVVFVTDFTAMKASVFVPGRFISKCFLQGQEPTHKRLHSGRL